MSEEKVILRPVRNSIIESALDKAQLKLEEVNRIVVRPSIGLYELSMSAFECIINQMSEVSHKKKEVVSVSLDNFIEFSIENRVSETGDKAGNISPNIKFGSNLNTIRDRKEEIAIDKPVTRDIKDDIVKKAMKVAREKLTKENHITIPTNDMLYEIMLSTLEAIVVLAMDTAVNKKENVDVEFDDIMSMSFSIKEIDDGFEVVPSIDLGPISKLDVKDDASTEEHE